jgi:hypothetical protein
MTTATPDPRLDRLYRLLPAIYRMRDAEQGLPLQALLRVIARQVNLVEDDIGQLYRNWFIETGEDWVVPYIGDLIGYRPVLPAGEAGQAATREGRLLERVLVPRREVANTIRYRRRRGTLAVLELLAQDVADWPARAVEFFKLLGWNQHLAHPHLSRARTADLRAVERLDLLDGPLDSLAHSVDVRRISSTRTGGRYNIPSVGVFVWRLRSYSVTHSPSYGVERAGPHCNTFSVLGQDAPLFIHPEPEPDDSHIAGELNVPAPMRRQAFARHAKRFYGPNRSLAIWAGGWAGFDPKQPVPVSAIVPADLSDWTYLPEEGHIAVDPVLGRFAFPPSQLPDRGLRVTYHYGFSADMGGGEYNRSLSDPSARTVVEPDPHDPSTEVRRTVDPSVYRVGPGTDQFRRIAGALAQWRKEDPWDAVIELTESAVYVEQINITLKPGRTLQLRAANRTRPVIRLLDWNTELPDALTVTLGRGSRFTMDGLMVTGRPVHLRGPERPGRGDRADDACGARVVIRHCTLVPGWGLGHNCEPQRPAEPSLELYNVRASLHVAHSILGSIQVNEDEVTADPIPVCIVDSILDATGKDREAFGSPHSAMAHAVLTMRRSTVFGIVEVHAVELAENSLFAGCVNVARRQLGCMRFCYVPPHCRTPRRYRCQPDLVEQAVKDITPAGEARDAAIANEQLRVRPQFTSIRYGNPGYAQLARTCAMEIARGADDESEMGAFHDLFQPQREINLRTRLEEYTPADMDVGVLFAT